MGMTRRTSEDLWVAGFQHFSVAFSYRAVDRFSTLAALNLPLPWLPETTLHRPEAAEESWTSSASNRCPV